MRWSVRIVELTPPRRAVWQWHPGAVDPAVDYSKETPTTVTFTLEPSPAGTRLTVSETGFELIPLLKAGLFTRENLLEDMLASLNAAELSKRQFREIARVAGLVFQGFPHAGKTARQLQASSGLFFDVFTRYDPGNLLVSQAHLAAGRVVVTTPRRTPPLAFPLLVDRTREAVTSESLADRVRRMQVMLEKYADAGK